MKEFVFIVLLLIFIIIMPWLFLWKRKKDMLVMLFKDNGT